MTSRIRTAGPLVALVLLVSAAGVFQNRAAGDDARLATARRGTFTATLTEAGVLRSAESVTYRSPLEGREVEVTYLAPEGTHVREGELLVRLDTAALKSELERATQATRQVELELEAADVDRQEAELAVAMVTEGAGSIAWEEAKTTRRLAAAKAARLREEHDRLRPLLEKGFITRDELERSALDVEEAEARAELADRALRVLEERTRPAEEQTARLQLARRKARIEHLQPRLAAARAHERALGDLIERCAIYAPRPGLVVYEENLSTAPRRKIRVGDRVTPSQGLVTLPDLRRMVVESSIRESDMEAVTPGQLVRVRVDAYPDLRLSGVVSRVGALAQADGSGGARFALVVTLDGEHPGLRPAMNARIDVVIAERPDAVTVPLAAIAMRDGVPVCYVARGASFERRIVEIGRANDTDVEILAGLRPGERVSLVEPAGHED